MMPRFVCLLFCGCIALSLGNTQKLPRVKRQSLKVQINATDDTVCMRYLRPSQGTKLEGFVLGYGNNFFSNQYIPLPSEGKNYVTELDAEPRYLVSVRPARVSNNKKSCSARNKAQKPLQLVVGTLTPTSVFLSWGILVNPQHDWTATSNCAGDRFYTVRYREKGKDKKWVFQLCPATETVIDNLKPNTPYEFGVKDNAEDSIWSKTLNHKTVLSSKKVNGQLQNMYKLVPNSQTQIILSDNKKLVPVTIIKQIIQNRTQSKAPDSSSLPGAILVHLIVPGLNESQQKLPPLLTIDDIPQASRKKLAKNETGIWPAESKTPEVQEISPQSLPAQAEKTHGPEDFKSTPKPKLVQTQNIPAPKVTQRVPSKPKTSPKPHIPQAKDVLESITLRTDQLKPTIVPRGPQYVPSKPRTSPSPEVPRTRPASKDTYHRPSKPKTSPSPRVPPTRATPRETLLIPSKSKTAVGPEVPQTKPVPNETYHISPRPKIGQATEIPWFDTAPHKTRLTSARPQPSDKSQTRPAFSKTTLAPARTKAPALPKWIVPTTDDFYTPEATARPIDLGVKRPPEYVDTWQKPISVTIPPGPQHPPIPPARPTQMRRKPLPPNTVTGKPGSPAKPAGPTPPVRTGTLYKTPTAFATPEYYVDETVFSSSPTSETDSSGKPRYQAPHVKYMKKDDDVPCSITSSLEHFPQEEVGSKEEPTRPPQNPPTNLTVVTVEGCPSFVILDWEKPDNDTVTEYEVVSTENGGSDGEKEKSIITTNQTHSTVENLKPDTSYEFHVKPRNPLGEGPSSNVVAFSTESADPRVSEPISMGKDAIWTEIPFNSDTYSECKGKQYVKRTWYKKFVGVQLCNSLRYKIYLSDSLTGKFYNIGDQRGHGEDHCQFVDSFLDGRTGQQEDLPVKDGFFRAVRQEPVKFGKIGGETQINYVRWYECGTSIPGKW
uniref:ABI family member 3 binding protein n=1 Tax=Taeniopygia guttata TaxID=59729 RepID=A0A674GWN9_TAEGU